MQTYYEDEQVSLFAPGGSSGRMCREHSHPAPQRVRTSASSWKKSSEFVSIPYMFLDLTPGHGDLLGEPYWEICSPWRGERLTRNTGVSPRGAAVSSLLRILLDKVPKKYYLTKTACLGILRRALQRGKELPVRLKLALELQSGLRRPTQAILTVLRGEAGAYHINQRNEGIDLGEVSGALMATQNMQMQTFVAEPPQAITAFSVNQRDEVRDLHDVTGALQAQPGMKQQTFVAAFSAGASAGAGTIGYGETAAPTLKGSPSGNCMPSILCINDQGGKVMGCSENITGTLRAQEHGHQPLILRPAEPKVYENHGIDGRYTGPHDVAPTMSARYGTGGNNIPLVQQEEVICIAGNAIDRQPQNGGNGMGWQKDVSYTLTATDKHAVMEPYQETIGTLCYGDEKGVGNQYVSQDKCIIAGEISEEERSVINLVRRLVPLECERLQGFPDGWTDIPGASDSARYKALGNSVAIPCVMFLMQGIRYVVDRDSRKK